MHQKLLCAIAAAAVVSPFVLRVVVRLASPRPANLGVSDGRLADAPKSPNCVSTQATDVEHKIEPLVFDGEPEAAFKRLQMAVDVFPRTTLVTASDRYLHYEFTTLICGYIDDVEFVLDARNKQIQFRSASRLGRADLGANRKRMEAIRTAFESPSKP